MNNLKEVCFIEDDRVQIFLLNKFIEKLGGGYKATSFANGKLAFDEMETRARESRPFPGIIFLDLNMPVWNGWVFYNAFSRLAGHEFSKVIILTSSLSDDDYKKSGITGFRQ
jgi:CheY-like chemotaxis protein